MPVLWCLQNSLPISRESRLRLNSGNLHKARLQSSMVKRLASISSQNWPTAWTVSIVSQNHGRIPPWLSSMEVFSMEPKEQGRAESRAHRTSTEWRLQEPDNAHVASKNIVLSGRNCKKNETDKFVYFLILGCWPRGLFLSFNALIGLLFLPSGHHSKSSKKQTNCPIQNHTATIGP